jgi:hypothetical protein
MKTRMLQTLSHALTLALGTVVPFACTPPADDMPETTAPEPETARPPRGSLAKADAAGSCRDATGRALCGGPGTGNCYCDAACAEYGDCCSNLADVCEAAPPSPPSAAPVALDCEQAGDVCEASPAGAAAYRLYRDTLRTAGALDEDAVRRLAAFLRGDVAGAGSVRAFLEAVLAHPNSPFTGDARDRLVDALAGRDEERLPLENPLYALRLGNRPQTVLDDVLHLRGTGTVGGRVPARSHSRGYAKKAEGILRRAHGSQAPARPGLDTAEETRRLRTQGPGAALDRAAAIGGLNLGRFGFVYRANERFYSPRAAYWEGLCHAWSYGALDERVNALVDVEGAAGARGLWIFGEWLSRADLGNWMMAVSDQLSVADTELVDPYVTPLDWLLGVTQWILSGDRGLRADLFNDAERGASEVWNQPVVSASLTVDAVSPEVAEAVLAHARRDAAVAQRLPARAGVRRVDLSALWGAEVDDAHEAEPALAESIWRMFVVVDEGEEGRAVVGYLAHHLAAAGVRGLPVAESAPLPDYFAYPKNEVLDAAFGERTNTLLSGALDGPVFRFFVGTVLAHGVPEPTRAAFEAEVKTFSSAPPTDAALNALAARYPGIANAYSPEQWQRVFEPALGPGEGWGARWGLAGATR